MVKKGQSQRQTQIVNVNVKGDKKAKRRRGKKGKKEVETRIIPAFNPPPIINYPPAFNQQFNPNQWLSPPAPAPPRVAPKVLVEGETAETLGVPAYTPVDLTLESRLRTAEPAPDIAKRAVEEWAVEPFPPAEFVPSSSPLADTGTEPEILPPEILPEILPPPPPELFTSPVRLAPGETLPPITPASGDKPKKKLGRPPGAKGKPKAVGVVFEPVVGEPLVPPEAGIPLGQLSPSEFTAIPPRRTYVLGKEPIFPTRAVSDPGLPFEEGGYFSPVGSPQPISFLGEGVQAEPRKSQLERQRQEGFSGRSGMRETISPSESYLFTEA